MNFSEQIKNLKADYDQKIKAADEAEEVLCQGFKKAFNENYAGLIMVPAGADKLEKFSCIEVIEISNTQQPYLNDDETGIVLAIKCNIIEMRHYHTGAWGCFYDPEMTHFTTMPLSGINDDIELLTPADFCKRFNISDIDGWTAKIEKDSHVYMHKEKINGIVIGKAENGIFFIIKDRQGNIHQCPSYDLEVQDNYCQ